MGVMFTGNPYEVEYESDDNELGEWSTAEIFVEDVDEESNSEDFNTYIYNEEEDDEYNPADDEDYEYNPNDDDIEYISDVTNDQSDYVSFYESEDDEDELDYVTYPLEDTSPEVDKTSNETPTVAEADSD